ncbi:zinc finger protein 836-like [Ruditapes philippinarum]|uniref:zinc finger protein 836-like n=1 Tax=Ruditapes philippinarum TaxID=129788 RepID=UPI00295B23D2|nr:zinc finger protein 836-like [Ruditapes philippinarum]
MHSGRVRQNRVCSFCAKVFASPFALRRHLLIHTGEMPFKCDMCNKSFNQKAHLKVHQVTHLDKDLYYVSHTDQRSSKNDGERNLHLQSGHSSSQDHSHECNYQILGHKLSVKSLFEFRIIIMKFKSSHQNTTKNLVYLLYIKNHHCKRQCQRGCNEFILTIIILYNYSNLVFSGLTELGVGQTTVGGASGKSGHSCEFCGKYFRNMSWLKRHLTMHTGERPFKCHICGKGFGVKGNLMHHMAVHYVAQ